ncbi:flagellar operon protein [Caldanaerovirga acetigignens]|uniref:Flagellar operon protein n=1 Tax=Caldanaerovirga acetigignens TaxID=447595 RepID=A0A1M7G4C6_9FIRM|nr:TIGR02530 family flagellar biosynthesis protein [Caldanaerovirga acetigignens]SHM10699.1 flagellar operon protein [Caldanaerovirga acetigignens]
MNEYMKLSLNLPINKIEPAGQGKPRQEVGKTTGDFQKILEEKLGRELKVSKHAMLRMTSRNINLTSEQLEKLNAAVEKAEKKGVRESLILINDIAFVVSIKNRTIITAVDGPNLKENLFTNIDGAVIM